MIEGNISKKELLEIYTEAFENESYLLQGSERKKHARNVMYFFIFATLFSKRIKGCPKNIVLRNGDAPAFEKIDSELSGTSLFYGKAFLKQVQRKKRFSLFSYAPFYRHFLMWCKGIGIFVSVKKEKNSMPLYLGYFLEVFFWSNWFREEKPNCFIYDGHYDRLTVVLSELAKMYNVEYVMYQHGIIGDKNSYQSHIPHKIYVTRFYGLNKIDIEVFKECIISNPACKYYIYSRKKPQFLEVGNESFSVGIIDQPLEIYKEIIQKLVEQSSASIFIMLHPLSDKKAYLQYDDCAKVKVLETDKVFDVDCLVTVHSTMVLEYCQWGYLRPIYILGGSYMEQYTRLYSNLVTVNNIDELVYMINEKANIGSK